VNFHDRHRTSPLVILCIWVPGASSPEVKRPENDIDRSCPRSVVSNAQTSSLSVGV
jgi:hypothetical protein